MCGELGVFLVMLTDSKKVNIFPIISLLIFFSILIIGMPGSADYDFQSANVINFFSRHAYIVIKLAFMAFFYMSLRCVGLSGVKSVAIFTSPVVVAIIFREGFDFMSLLPALMIFCRRQLDTLLILFFSIVLYSIYKEISILFVLLISYFLFNFRLGGYSFKSIILVFGAFSFLMLLFFFLGPLREMIIDSVGGKILSIELTHEKNADFSFFKSLIVFILSHSYFIFSDTPSIVYAMITSIFYVPFIMKYFLHVPKYEALTLLAIYAAVTIFFKTFQHLRIYPFIYFSYFRYLNEKDCSYMVIVNLVNLFLFLLFFNTFEVDSNPVTNVFKFLYG